MAVEIELQRRVISLTANQKAQHADHFGPFFIDSGRVEIIDLDIGFRPHGMGQRACILAELAGAQLQHVFNAFDRRTAHIGAELLVAEDGQAFLEA